MHTFDQVGRWLDDICDNIPDEYMMKLNGGVYLLPDTKFSAKIPSGHHFVMGEYIHDPVLGDRVFLYYGSIMAIHIDDSEEELKAELREIILHEVRHHVERLAGNHDLEVEDQRYVERELQKSVVSLRGSVQYEQQPAAGKRTLVRAAGPIIL